MTTEPDWLDSSTEFFDALYDVMTSYYNAKVIPCPNVDRATTKLKQEIRAHVKEIRDESGKE